MSRKWIVVVFFLVLGPGGNISAQSVDFSFTTLDQLIENSLTRPNDVAVAVLVPARVSFRAELVSMPSPQPSEYLKSALAVFGTDPMPEISNGIVLRSGLGREQLVYVEDGVALEIANELEPGDEALFYGYLVFNSHRGPGLLISACDPPPTWWERIIGSFAEGEGDP